VATGQEFDHAGPQEIASALNVLKAALDHRVKVDSAIQRAALRSLLCRVVSEQFDAAEVSARSGLKVDPDHRVPRLEHLLGLVLAGKKDYVQAAEHMRAFMKYSTQPADLAEGQKMLTEIEKRSAQANLSTESPK